MSSIPRTLVALLLVALLVTPAIAQSSSAKTQAVFTASQLAKRTTASFKQYERMEAAGRLMELDGSKRPLNLGIAASLRRELSMAVGAYLKAMDSGWKASDPELTKARETIQAIQKKMDAVGVWTCFAWDEARLPDAARDSLDKIRMKAWEGTLLVKAGQIDEAAAAFAFARELIDEHGEAIGKQLDRGQDVVDTRKHPAYARTVAEVDRLQASVQPSLDAVTGKRQALVDDVKALAATADKAAPFFREVGNARGFSGTEEAIIAAVEGRQKKIDAFQSGPEGEVKAALATFLTKYGEDREAVQKSVTKIMGGKSLDVPHSPGFLVDQIKTGLAATAEARPRLVKELLEIAGNNSRTNNADPARREAAFAMARHCLNIALAIDPANADANKLIDGLGAGAAAADEKADAALDKGVWDDHMPDFPGPGSVGSLAASAKKWLAGPGKWTKDKDILAVRVSGDWVVAERDREGRPVAWGLPIEAAFKRHTDRDADRDVAKVFRLTMVTRDNEKSPPWKAARVGSNRQMRASKIDEAGSGSGPNALFKLALVVALLASGFILVGPVVTSRVPALGGLYRALVPLRPIIGVATLGIGVVLLILSLFSPMSDILPLVAAIVAGLFLGIELLLKKRPEAADAEGAKKSVDAAVGKAQDFLAGQEQNIRKIEKIQVPLGVACLVLALIHLFAAQVMFF